MALRNALEGLAVESKQAALVSTVPDNAVAAPPVRVVGEDITACSFADTGASLVTTDMIEMANGTGVGVSQANSNLLITTGIGTNAEYLVRSVRSWRGALLAKVKVIMSQRIVNQNLMVLLADLIGENLNCTINSATSITVTKVGHGFTAAHVGQGMMIGGITGAAGVPGRYVIASIPTVNTINFTVAGWPGTGSCTLDLFGHTHVKNLYTGITATVSAFATARRGWTTADAALTVLTPVTGHVFQMHNDGRQVYAADSLVASTATPNFTSRGCQFENIPDDNLDLYLFIWSYNGTVAPASTSTWTIGFWSVEKYANTPVYIAGVRPQGTQPPLPVALPGTQAVSFTQPAQVAGTALMADVGHQLRAGAGGLAAPTRLVSAAAGTNATLVKGSAGRVVKVYGLNAAAAVRYLKFFNKATAPTPGTDVPVVTFALQAGVPFNIDLGGMIGEYFATGIGFTLTTGAADLDTGALTAGDVLGLNVWFA